MFDDLREPEVEYLRVAAIGHEDVRGLDVAVNDALGVRRVERIRDLNADVEQRVDTEWLGAHPVLQCAPFQEFHREEGPSLGFLDFVDRADVWMIQRRCGARLALEALERLRIADEIVREEFQRGKPAEPRVFGLVDHTHAAAAQLLDDAIVRDGLANHRGGVGEPYRPVGEK